MPLPLSAVSMDFEHKDERKTTGRENEEGHGEEVR